MWKTVATRQIFSHPRLTLIEDEVLLPNGEPTTYLRFDDRGGSTTSVIAIRDDGKILVQREYSHPLSRIIWQLPGGGIYAWENIEDATNRELMEESGFRAGTLRPLGSYCGYHRRTTVRTWVFLATDLTAESLPGDPEESIESHWMTESEIDALVRSGEFEDGFSLATWCLYKTRAV